MRKILRWTFILCGTFIIGLALIFLVITIQDSYMKPQFQLLIIFIGWIVVWIASGLYLKKKQSVKQPFAYGFMCSLFFIMITATLLQYLSPNLEKILVDATESEQAYFLLAEGSVDHSRICNAAYSAYENYKKLQDQEKIKLFEYILLKDKCL